MNELKAQLETYLTDTTSPIDIDDLIGTHRLAPDNDLSPGRERFYWRPAVAISAAAVVVMMIGAPLLILGFVSGGPSVDSSGTATTVHMGTPGQMGTTAPPLPSSTTLVDIEPTTVPISPIPMPDNEEAEGQEPAAGPVACDEPIPILADGPNTPEPWVYEMRSKVATLVRDVNVFGETVWDAAPNDQGWSDTEAVATALDLVNGDLADLRAYSTATLQDSGLSLSKWGWTETNPDQGRVEGPIWWLPEGIWSSTQYFQTQVLPNFLATTGTSQVRSYYVNGETTAGPCGMTKHIVDAMNGIIDDSTTST